MKYTCTFVWAFLMTCGLYAQVNIGFESIGLPVDSFLNGSEGSGGYSEGDVFLSNTFTDYGGGCCWEGWAVSTNTDSLTPGVGNQYSAISGNGNNASLTYAVSFSFGENKVILSGDAIGNPVPGIYVNNNAYAYYSILNGDAYAKKFGGVTGDDPDFFLLTIKAYYDGQLKTDSVDFYLADYRFSDNSEDYIVDEWTYVDLSSLGDVDSLGFSLSSSDNGAFGMNTPSYFCLDDIQVNGVSTGINSRVQRLPLSFYPNPATTNIRLDWSGEASRLGIFNITGQLVKEVVINQGANNISVEELVAGSYMLRANNNDQVYSAKLIVSAYK